MNLKRKRSLAQIQASLRNGAKSKGPLSPATQAISAQNALKHGLTAHTILLDGESQERFQQLLEETVAHLRPQNTLEYTAVEEIVVALWKQRRAWALEAASFRAAQDKHHDDPAARQLKAWRQLHPQGHDFPNLLLQQARIDRQLDRAYRRFLHFSALRDHTPTATTPHPDQHPSVSTVERPIAHPTEPEHLSAFQHQNTQKSTPEPSQTTDSTTTPEQN